MSLQLSLLCFIFFLLPLASSDSIITKPGCLHRCGALSIPYPFGVGPGCSRERSFNIICNTSTIPAKAYLTAIGKEVVEINQTYVRVKYPNLVSVCYDSSEYGHGNATVMTNTSVNLTGTLYHLSTNNRLAALGCDDRLTGIVQRPNGSSIMGTCSTICPDQIVADDYGYCSYNDSVPSYGCCQVLTDGETETGLFGAQLSDLSGRLSRQRLFPCSYAFIQEVAVDDTSLFSYPLNYLHNSTAMLNDNWASATRLPVVNLAWSLEAENCSQAKLNLAIYACEDKSVCVDKSESGFLMFNGYLCKCVEGYEGNPYLPGGCKPISIPSSIAKPGCLDRCGRLLIPFPFGVGEKCSLAPSFNIRCNATTNPPIAYLVALDAEIRELTSSRVLVHYWKPGFACYDFSDYERGIKKIRERSLIIDLSRTPFMLSEDNWITTIGCDNMVVGRVRQGNLSFIGGGCTAACGEDSIDSGFCTLYGADRGCCRAAVPRGTTYLEANLTIINGERPPSNSSCTYTVMEHLRESNSLGYPFAEYSTNDLLPSSDMPVTGLEMEWRIGAVSCKEALSNPATFACKSNSYCFDFDDTLGGYLCNCSQGFHGNPYLSPGCKDIDECADNPTNLCDPISKCMNTQGSYYCSCPKGYAEDGDGIRCFQLPPSKSKTIILKGLGAGLGLILLVLLCLSMHRVFEKIKRRKHKEDLFKRILLQQQTSEGTFGKTKLYTAKELAKATDGFNESRVCGQGGQGVVYKGMLSDGTIVAIKRLKHVDENQVEQFINEVVILSQINHKNVVRLLGCCLATEEPLLVYEFLPNGTLFDFIHVPKVEFPLTWDMRLKIASEVAEALAYLHSASSIPIYHRDIKSKNILLDDKYIVKVSDFGISKLVEVDQTHLTTLVKGTFGYLDPEYYQTSQYTDKSDVYSFGVVLVELLTGKRPISMERPEMERNLASHFLTCMQEESLDDILDAHVSELGEKEGVMAVAKLARRCLNSKGRMRPIMKEVATELESLRISQLPSIDSEEHEEAMVIQGKSMLFSDVDHTWTISDDSMSTSASATHPLMCGAV